MKYGFLSIYNEKMRKKLNSWIFEKKQVIQQSKHIQKFIFLLNKLEKISY